MPDVAMQKKSSFIHNGIERTFTATFVALLLKNPLLFILILHSVSRSLVISLLTDKLLTGQDHTVLERISAKAKYCFIALLFLTLVA